MTTPEERLMELGLALPEPVTPLAAYIPVVRTGSHAYVSGQVPLAGGEPVAIGRLGAEVDLDTGRAAARVCAVNILAALKAELGDLSRVARVVKLTVFVASEPGFTDQPKVANAASELLGEVFGEHGRHARSAVGVAGLPLGVPVEIEAIVEVA